MKSFFLIREKVKLDEMKNEKNSKFWSISLEHFVEHKPLISEECNLILPSSILSKDSLGSTTSSIILFFNASGSVAPCKELPMKKYRSNVISVLTK